MKTLYIVSNEEYEKEQRLKHIYLNLVLRTIETLKMPILFFTMFLATALCLLCLVIWNRESWSVIFVIASPIVGSFSVFSLIHYIIYDYQKDMYELGKNWRWFKEYLKEKSQLGRYNYT